MKANKRPELWGGDGPAIDRVECPNGYVHIGKDCFSLPFIVEKGSFVEAQLTCDGRNMLYYPGSVEQNIAFRKSLLGTVS